MSNDAEHLEALLAEYVDGGLDAASAKVVDDHLAKHPATRAAVEQMKLDREAVQSLPRVTAPADLSEDLRGRLERDLLLNVSPIGANRALRFSPPMAAIAAMVMVGLGLAGLAYTLLGNRPKPYPDVALHDAANDVETTTRSARLAASEAADAEQKSFALAGDPSTAITAKPTPSDTMRERPADSITASVAQAVIEPAIKPAVTPAEKAEVPSGPTAATEAEILPGVVSARDETTGGSSIAAPLVKADATPMQVEPALAVSDDLLPADAAAAIVGRLLDPARRSIVVVVDEAHALDAFAFASRFTKFEENALEVTDAGQRLTTLPRTKDLRDRDAVPEAELAVVARGLPEASASSIQSELRRVDAKQSAAFEVKPLPSASVDDQRKQADIGEATRPATPAAADPSATSQPTTLPATSAAIGGSGFNVSQTAAIRPSQLIDLYVVVRQQAMPTSQPTSQPSSQTTTLPAP